MNETESGARDRVLCEAARNGDESAWRVLHAQAFDPIHAFVRRRAGPDPHRIEDVVQETWMIAVRRLGDFDPSRGSFLAWLRGISVNVLRSHWRRRPDPAPSEAGEHREGAGIGPAHALSFAEQFAMAMAALPGRYQAVLRAKYEDQLPVAEIAARRQETTKAVESLLTRARTAFRGAYRRLEDRGVGAGGGAEP